MAGEDLSRYHEIVRRPLLTEKGTEQQEKNNVYHFMVSSSANKIEIRRAVEKIFNVNVLSVNTMMKRGKSRRIGRSVGKKRDWKKAAVKLPEGQVIEFI